MKKIFIVIFILIVVNLLAVGNGAVFGSSVSGMEESIGRLKKENEKMEIEISSLSSCTAISERARGLRLPQIVFQSEKIKESAVALKP